LHIVQALLAECDHDVLADGRVLLGAKPINEPRSLLVICDCFQYETSCDSGAANTPAGIGFGELLDRGKARLLVAEAQCACGCGAGSDVAAREAGDKCVGRVFRLEGLGSDALN
jgi:hypothetical protein